MKYYYYILSLICFCCLCSCADSKVFTTKDGTTIVAEPYGWLSKEYKIPGVEYELCTENLILDVIFSESIVVPIVLTGTELYEPVSYNEK